MARPTYSVEPRPVQRDRRGSPDKWVLKKGSTVLETFDTKRPAAARAKEVAKNQNATLAVYGTQKKMSDEFDYRTDEDKQQAASRANRKSVKRGLGSNFGPLYSYCDIWFTCSLKLSAVLPNCQRKPTGC